jgi:uncharacterized membrane protein YhhN
VARRATVVFVAVAAADTFLAATGHDRQRWLTKPLLMPALIVGHDRPTQRALALGCVGDVALLGASDVAFTAGLASFLAGHVAWIVAQRQRQRQGGGRLRARPALAAPYIAAFGALNSYLWKRTGKDRIPVIVYSTALLAMSLVALDCGSSKAAAGGALFLVSDTLLAGEVRRRARAREREPCDGDVHERSGVAGRIDACGRSWQAIAHSSSASTMNGPQPATRHLLRCCATWPARSQSATSGRMGAIAAPRQGNG